MPEWLSTFFSWLGKRFARSTPQQTASGQQSTSGDAAPNIQAGRDGKYTQPATESEEEPLTPYEIKLLKSAADHEGELSLDTSFTNRWPEPLERAQFVS